MSGLQLIAALIIAGGAIAYAGDRIGLNVGRRRLTLFGLRPKHTSIIITIITGALIAAASIGLLMTVSRDVRNSLFRMKEIQAELRQNRESLRTSLDQLGELQATVTTQKKALSTIEKVRNEAVEQRNAAQAQRDKLQGEYDKVQGDVEIWKARVAELKELSARLEDSVSKMQQTEQQLRQDVTILTDQYLALEGQMRTGSFIFQKDEIVAATVITGGRSAANTEADLLAFLEKADQVALAKGAQIDGKNRALTLAKDDHFFQTVKVLQDSKGDWVVRAVTSANTVKGEPVQVYFHLFPDERVYRKGQVIASRIINGGRADAEQDLLGLLQEVNRIAIGKGMITTADGDVGKVAGDKFIDAVVHLKRIGKAAKVTAVATSDIYITRGPLQLELKVVPVG